MQTCRHYSFRQTFYWARWGAIAPLLYSGAIVGAYAATGWSWMRLPWPLLSTVAVAVAFFVGFKNNASYDRLWEARKIWGAIVNASRSWTIATIGFVTDEFVESGARTGAVKEAREALVYRHIAWMAALRHLLRAPRSWEHRGGADVESIRAQALENRVSVRDEIEDLVTREELEVVLGVTNPAAALLKTQSEHLRALKRAGLIDSFRHIALQELLTELFTQQGRAERIKNFPFPRQYASFTLYGVRILIALAPFGSIAAVEALDPALLALAVPFSVLVSWIFYVAEKIGDASENPFEGLWNDVPITAMARGIEIDLREMLGESELPAPYQAVDNILL